MASSLLTPLTASLLLVLYTVAYVSVLYISKTTRPSLTLNRDHPKVIWGRTISVTLATLICNVFSYVIIKNASEFGTARNALELMGYWPLGLYETGHIILLNSILFAGPLFETLVVDGQWRIWFTGLGLFNLWTDIMSWRNIIVAPFTEEAMFRSAAVPLFVLAGVSPVRIIFLTPVLFGLAHVHHFYEFRITHPQVPVVMALIHSGVQFAYTTLFGTLATFFFMRTDSFLAVFLLHAQCNSLGFPRVRGSVCPYWLPLNTASGSAQVRVWTVAYYIILVLGAFMWYKNLWSLSYSPNGLY